MQHHRPVLLPAVAGAGVLSMECFEAGPGLRADGKLA